MNVASISPLTNVPVAESTIDAAVAVDAAVCVAVRCAHASIGL